VPGIGKSMLEKAATTGGEGRLDVHADLLKKYHPSMLEFVQDSGIGPEKRLPLIWSAYQVSDLDGVEKLAREGKIQTLRAWA